MTKSKAIVGAPVELVITRDENGVATNMQEYLLAKKKLETKRPKDVLKPHNKWTSGCLICKEFSKYRDTCPTCGRPLICFGRAVKNPKKGSTKAWKSFLQAYATPIYHACKELYPCEEYKALELVGAGVKDPNMQYDPRPVYKQQGEVLKQWVLDFDKFLTKNFRGKK